jgi:Bacterial Ig-like domain
MNSYHDPELDDVLREDDLRHIASVLSSSRTAEPPLDEAFQTGLRRQLMNEAWAMTEGRESWWRRAFAPPGLAWAGAAAGLLLIASVVVYTTLQQPGGINQIVVNSPLDGNRNVALQQPILVSFNQPMDHASTESAVQITPATNTTYSWADNSRTLVVQPTGGTLAPNTQYQVTIGQGAKTAAGKPLSAPQTVTFVTTPPPAPATTPTPRPTPSAALGEKPLASLGGAKSFAGQWSSDSSTVYYVDGQGALRVASPLKGGTPDVIAPDGVSSPAISLTGDRLAYIRGGKIEVLTFASGKTDELAVTPAPLFVGWGKDRLYWAAETGIFTPAADGSSQMVAPLPSAGAVSVVSIAPDGAHAVYTQDQKTFVLDLTTRQSAQLGGDGAVFQDWSPGGTQLLYSTADNVVVSNTSGATLATLPSGDASWSSQDAILIGGDTDVLEVRPDGSNPVKISSGTYRSPVWAPNATTFAFVRGGTIWTAAAPALPPEPTALDEATKVVNDFMNARLAGQQDQATAFLDDGGKAAYAPGGLNLIVRGDPAFSRFYILTGEVVSSQPDTARFVVRLVLTHRRIDVSDFEETLTLVRDASTQRFMIDQATAGSTKPLGRGAQVVSVDVQTDTVKVTFDSDLDPGTVTGAVTIVDAKGNPIEATASYANRVVTLSGLNLKPGDHIKLVVLTSLHDVQGQPVATDYELDLVGPAGKKHPNHKDATTPSPSPSPSASPGA